MRRFCSLFALLVLLCFAFVLPVLAAGSDVPSVPAVDGAYFISISGSSLGACDIFIPANYASGYLTLLDGVPYNVSTNSVSGYVLDSSGEISYYVRFPSFSDAEFRSASSSGSYSYSALNITGVSSSNVVWLDYDMISADRPTDYQWYLIFAGLLGLVVVVCFIKR